MIQNIDGVDINVQGWYSGESTALSWIITVRVEVEIIEPLICNVHIYTNNQSIFGNTIVRDVPFQFFSIEDKDNKLVRLKFGSKLMAEFEGTVIGSIEGQYASLSNQVLLEIKVEYSPLWLSRMLYPRLSAVGNPSGAI
jgi:hypothetical protein